MLLRKNSLFSDERSFLLSSFGNCFPSWLSFLFVLENFFGLQPTRFPCLIPFIDDFVYFGRTQLALRRLLITTSAFRAAGATLCHPIAPSTNFPYCRSSLPSANTVAFLGPFLSLPPSLA